MATDLGKSSVSTRSKHEAFVEKQIERTRKRIWGLDVTFSGLGLAILVLAYGLGMALLDRSFSLPVFVRLAALTGFAAYLLFFLIAKLILPLYRPVNPLYAAQQLERTLPGAKNSVINWLDLRRENLPPAILSAVGRRAANEVAKADLERAASARQVVWVGGAAVVLLLAMLGLLINGPGQFWSLMSRTFLPFLQSSIAAETELTIVKPRNGNATVPVSQPVTILARADGRPLTPSRLTEPVSLMVKEDSAGRVAGYENPPVEFDARAAMLHLRSAERGDWTLFPMERDDDGYWQVTIPENRVLNGFYYRVTGGDGQTPIYRIQVEATALVREIDVGYHYPQFLRMSDAFTKQPNLEAARGTEVELVIRTNRQVAEGTLEVEIAGEKKTVAGSVLPEDAEAFHCKLPMTLSGSYRVHFTSKAGESYTGPVRYTIDVIPTSEVTYTYRPYLGWKPQTFQVAHLPSPVALRGTRVDVRYFANHPVKDGRLEMQLGAEKVNVAGQTNPRQPELLQFSFVLDRDGRYILKQSGSTESAGDGRSYPIKVLADAPPRVELKTPGKDIELPANEILKLAGSATDDFGIKGLTLRMHVLEKNDVITLDPKPYRQGKVLKTALKSLPTFLDYQDYVELEKVTKDNKRFELRPEMVLEYWLEAVDNCDYPEKNTNGQMAESKHYKVTIKEPRPKDEKQKERNEQQAKQEQKQHEQEQDQQLGNNKEEKQPPEADPNKARQQANKQKQNDEKKSKEDAERKLQDELNKQDSAKNKEGAKNEDKGKPGQGEKGAAKKGEDQSKPKADPGKAKQSPKSSDDKASPKEKSKGEAKSQSGEEKGESKSGGNEQKKDESAKSKEGTKGQKGSEPPPGGSKSGGKEGTKQDQRGSEKANGDKQKAGQASAKQEPAGSEKSPPKEKSAEASTKSGGTAGKEDNRAQAKQQGKPQANETKDDQGSAKGDQASAGTPKKGPNNATGASGQAKKKGPQAEKQNAVEKKGPGDDSKQAGSAKAEKSEGGSGTKKGEEKEPTLEDVKKAIKKANSDDPAAREQGEKDLAEQAKNAKDADVREKAKEALEKLQSKGSGPEKKEPTLEDVKKAMEKAQSQDPADRKQAEKDLANQAKNAKDEGVRKEAEEALKKLQSKGTGPEKKEPTLEDVKKAMEKAQSQDPADRKQAEKDLANQAKNAKDEGVRKEAEEALKKLQSKGTGPEKKEPTLEDVKKAMEKAQSQDPADRKQAEKDLANQAKNAKDEGVREEAKKALEKLKDEGADPMKGQKKEKTSPDKPPDGKTGGFTPGGGKGPDVRNPSPDRLDERSRKSAGSLNLNKDFWDRLAKMSPEERNKFFNKAKLTEEQKSQITNELKEKTAKKPNNSGVKPKEKGSLANEGPKEIKRGDGTSDILSGKGIGPPGFDAALEKLSRQENK